MSAPGRAAISGGRASLACGLKSSARGRGASARGEIEFVGARRGFSGFYVVQSALSAT